MYILLHNSWESSYFLKIPDVESFFKGNGSCQNFMLWTYSLLSNKYGSLSPHKKFKIHPGDVKGFQPMVWFGTSKCVHLSSYHVLLRLGARVSRVILVCSGHSWNSDSFKRPTLLAQLSLRTRMGQRHYRWTLAEDRTEWVARGCTDHRGGQGEQC